MALSLRPSRSSSVAAARLSPSVRRTADLSSCPENSGQMSGKSSLRRFVQECLQVGGRFRPETRGLWSLQGATRKWETRVGRDEPPRDDERRLCSSNVHKAQRGSSLGRN